MQSNLTGSHTSAKAYRRMQCCGESYLASHTPLLLDRLLVRRAGVVDLPSDVEPRFAYIAGHGEATEMDRY